MDLATASPGKLLLAETILRKNTLPEHSMSTDSKAKQEKSLDEQKRERQERDRELVRTGKLKQEDLFAFPKGTFVNAKIRWRTKDW